MITLNSRIVDDADGITLAELLLREKYTLRRVAVECNGEIVPRLQYDCKQLSNGDVVEVVCFVGGG